MLFELQELGLAVHAQAPIKVYYRDQVVGEYFADLLVENCIVVELKSVERLIEAHYAQLINYLKGTRFEVGLLLNFGPKPEVKRKIYETARRSSNPF